jgi:hypothetical protein
MPVVVVISQHVLNVFVQLANKRGFKKNLIEAEQPQGHSATGRIRYIKQNPITLSEFEPTILRLGEQCLIHLSNIFSSVVNSINKGNMQEIQGNILGHYPN